MNLSTFLTSFGAVLVVCVSAGPAAAQPKLEQSNLVSDIPGLAKLTDPDLINAWGVSFAPASFAPTTPFWISDNGAGVSTLYAVPGSGPLTVSKAPLTVTIPPTSGGTTSAPTGQVFNGGVGFGGAVFLFDTEDGVIGGWSGGTDAIRNVDEGVDAVYKGLAIANAGTSNAVLYATNFRAGTIEAYDPSFSLINLPGKFDDPSLPAGYAPFNDVVINGELYVTYAKQDAAKHDDAAGPGLGIVDVFTFDGVFDKRLISNGGVLNSPWGMAIAPSSFGSLAGDLLVGNFGDGKINAFDPTTGAFRGALLGTDGNPIVIDGLWALTVGNGSPTGGSFNSLYFTAGLNGEKDGLFGSLTVVPEASSWAMLLLGFAGLGAAALRHRGTSHSVG